MEDLLVDGMGPLVPHWKRIAEIVAPLLTCHRHLSYRLGLLLHGDCGKSVAIRYAARALGMKWIHVECLDLPHGMLGDAYQILDSIHDAAKKFAPCFIVLRHLQFFMNALKQENEVEGDANASAAISTVLHKLTKLGDQDPEKHVACLYSGA